MGNPLPGHTEANSTMSKTSSLSFLIWPFIGMCLSLLFSQVSIAAKQGPIKVIVNATYLDVHTGPGRGYPIFHVLEKNQTITLIKSKTDWIKVFLEQENGVIKEGWVHRRYMQYTIGVNGELVDLDTPDIGVYKKRRWESGISLGEFQGVAALGVHTGYRFTKNLILEARAGQSTGSSESNEFWSIGFLHQPFPGSRLSPYFTLASGQIKISPNATSIRPVGLKNNYFLVGIGAYYYLSNRIMLRLEYNNYNILPSRNENVNIDEWRLGLSTFF